MLYANLFEMIALIVQQWPKLNAQTQQLGSDLVTMLYV